MRLILPFSFILLLLAGSTLVHAQQTAPSDTSGKKQIQILHADRLNFEKLNDSSELQSLGGNVIVKQDKTFFYCDSAVINKAQNILQAFGHVHINDNDSINTYSDYLKYLGKEKKAFLKDNVKLTDGKGVLTTNELEYDVATKIGIYTKGGKLVSGKTVLTSTEGVYYGETKDTYFKKKVVLVDPDYTIKTDTLLYNSFIDKTTFIVPTIITSGSSTKVLTSDGYYDLKNKKAYFGKRPVIQDSTTTLIADEVATDDSTGFGEARGHVIYKDTAQGTMLTSNNLKTNKKEGSYLATEKPVMAIKQDKDSIFIAADTLFSAKLSSLPKDSSSGAFSNQPINKTDSSKDRYIEAYYHVRIFSDSLQAVGDSLYYSAQDSVFRLFKSPIVWAQENQITGDTIYLYTQNKKPKRLYVFENALAISKAAQGYFNQVKGRTINGYFKEGNIDNLHAKGNAESIYYGEDERKKFVGVNKSASDIIDMYFEDRKPQRVVLRSGLKGTFFPMRQVNHDELRLRGFKLYDDKRPKTKAELYSN